jgi:hypothetical protein
MNLKTGILLIIFCVALGAVIVGQRLQIRSVAFEAGAMEKELQLVREKNLVLAVELTRNTNPELMLERVRQHGLNLLPPDKPDPAPVQPSRRRG